MRIEVIDAICTDLEKTRKFKKIFKNSIPVWTDIKEFPAIAVVYESDTANRENLTNSKAFISANLPIYIYNKQRGSDTDDNLSDLVEVAQGVIEANTYVKTNCVEGMITSFKRDGGLLLPYSIAQLLLQIKYIKRLV
jgi:hypothetical protein